MYLHLFSPSKLIPYFSHVPCSLLPLEQDISSREFSSTPELCGFPLKSDFYLPDGAESQDILEQQAEFKHLNFIE